MMAFINIIVFISCIFLTMRETEGILRYRPSMTSTYPPWAFPCRCSEGCDTDKGECINGGTCTEGPPPQGYGWQGRACRYGNVAYKKSASQSGTYSSNGVSYIADLAVDGNTDQNHYHGSCAHTRSSRWPESWWMVDLLMVYKISKVIIYNRDDAKGRLAHFYIRVGNESNSNPRNNKMAYNFTRFAVNSEVVNIKLGNKAYGRFMVIDKYGSDQSHFLNICEVIVIGRKVVDCSSCKGECDDFNGCFMCPKGTKLPDCKHACDSEFYGINCESSCSSGCKSGEGRVCDIEDGRCLHGCQDGRYGKSFCELECSINCGIRGQGRICNETSGHCLQGCADDRYDLEFCDSQCPEYCSQGYGRICHALDGTCRHGCEDDMFGPFCNRTCGEFCLPGRNSSCTVTDGKCLYGCNNNEPLADNDWHVGDWCNIYVPSSFGALDDLRISVNVSEESVTITWGGMSRIKDPRVAPYIGYRVWLSMDGENFELYKNKTYTLGQDGFHHELLENLKPGAQYWIQIGVYRRYVDGTIYDSSERSMPISVVIPKVIKDAQLSSDSTSPGGSNIATVGSAVGGIMAVVLFGIGVFVTILLIRRRRNSKGEENHLVMNQRRSVQNAYENVQIPDEGGEINQALHDDENIDLTGIQTSPVEEEGNAYGNCGTNAPASTSVKVMYLGDYIKREKREKLPYNEEFMNIPDGPLLSCDDAVTPENIKKNRYKNIVAYDSTRIKLKCSENESDYINANYVYGYNGNAKEYVATQAPQPHTVNEFWAMIWQLKVNVIVMLTKQVEMGVTKCKAYWNEDIQGERSFNLFTLKTLDISECADFVIRRFNLFKEDCSMTIYQLQFLRWPDKRAPDQCFPLLNFLSNYRSYKEQYGEGEPTVVHCSAGVGRTGTFIAIDCLLQQAEVEGAVDVVTQISQMRLQRINMVQTRAQYEFIYDSIYDHLTFGLTSFPVSKQLPVSYHSEKLDILWKALKATNSTDDNRNRKGHLPENTRKNRDPSIIPGDKYRPNFATKSEKGNEYINAVFVDTYHEEKAAIVTQHPLPETEEDFWRLIYEQKCQTIVMLDTINDQDKTMQVYWPTEAEPLMHQGALEIRFVSSKCYNNINVREFTLNLARKTAMSPMLIRQYQMTSWDIDQDYPNPAPLLNLFDLVRSWNKDRGSAAKVLVHCLDGARKSGLYCAAWFLIDKLKSEREMDAVLAVRNTRVSRQQFIYNKEQFEFLYDLATQHDSTQENIYANT